MLPRHNLTRLTVICATALWLAGCGPKKADVPKEVRDELSGLGPPGQTQVAPGGMIHIVQRGETLNSICRRYGRSPSEVIQANDIYDRNLLKVGQRLVIPGGGGPSPQAAAPLQRVVAEPDMSGVISEPNFIWPLRGRILQPYDEDGHGLEHRHITIGGNAGDRVVAAKTGVVSFASENVQGYGKVIILQHSDGYSTFYGYLSKISVSPNDHVRQGHVIGEVGQTGRADSPQLLFKVFQGKQPVNPISYLP
ncbi:MAG: M23 family metallopeptidase [Planctomycetota bacterium]